MQIKNRAFTIIEILVVISVIAVLVGILLPALAVARDNARNAQCQANVKAIGDAMQLYLGDNRKTYPGGTFNGVEIQLYSLLGKLGNRSPVESGSNADPANRVLNSYLNTGSSTGATVAQCPLDKGTTLGAGTNSVYNYHGTSYAYFNRSPADIAANQYIGREGAWSINGHRDTEITKPAKKMLISDLPRLAVIPATDIRNQWHNKSDPLAVNMAFADGHVALIPRKIGNAALPALFQGVSFNNDIESWASNTPYY